MIKKHDFKLKVLTLTSDPFWVKLFLQQNFENEFLIFKKNISWEFDFENYANWELPNNFYKMESFPKCLQNFSQNSGNIILAKINSLTVRQIKGTYSFVSWKRLNGHCIKNNIFVKTLNASIIFSWFSAIDGNIIFSVNRKLKKISYFP